MILLAVSVAAALAISACGGDDDDGDDSDEVAEVVSTAFTSSDPADCTTLMTQAFIEQTEFESGDEAVTECEEDASDVVDSVEVSNVEVDGESAAAEAAFSGGGLGGQTLSYSLVKDDQQWKLDRIDEFVEFDQAAFGDAIAGEAEEDGVPEEAVDCITEEVAAADPEEIQAAYLSSDEEQLVSLVDACFEG